MVGDKIRKGIDWMVAITIIISLGYSYTSGKRYDRIIVYAPMIGFLVLAVLFFDHVKWMERLKQRDVDLSLVILGVGIAVASLVLVKSGWGAIFTVTNFLLVLYLMGEVKLDKKIYYAIGIACLVILSTWIGEGDKTYNTNLASMTIFAAASYGVTGMLYFFECKQKVVWGKSISLLVMLVLVLPMIMRLRAGCVLAGIGVLVILNYAIPAAVWGWKKLYNICVVLLIAGSIRFPLWYIWLWKKGVNVSAMTLGKGFSSGRNIVREQFLTALSKKPLTDTESDLLTFIPDVLFTEVHNRLLNIMVVHGVFVVTIVALLLGKRLIQFGEEASKNSLSRQCVSVIISLTVISVFENYFIITFYNILMFSVFCMGFGHQKDVSGDKAQYN